MAQACPAGLLSRGSLPPAPAMPCCRLAVVRQGSHEPVRVTTEWPRAARLGRGRHRGTEPGQTRWLHPRSRDWGRAFHGGHEGGGRAAGLAPDTPVAGGKVRKGDRAIALRPALPLKPHVSQGGSSFQDLSFPSCEMGAIASILPAPQGCQTDKARCWCHGPILKNQRLGPMPGKAGLVSTDHSRA